MPYSVKNKKVNFNPPNSILNPDTNSDSPSAKSKGERFISARITIAHAGSVKAILIIKLQEYSCIKAVFSKLYIIHIENTQININKNPTSYEIVWATMRYAPSRAYLELEAHPEPRIGYTFKLLKSRNITTLRLNSLVLLWTYKDHINNIITNPTTG